MRIVVGAADVVLVVVESRRDDGRRERVNMGKYNVGYYLW